MDDTSIEAVNYKQLLMVN